MDILSGSNDRILEVQGLKKYFPVYSKGLLKKKVADIKAVDDVSFSIRKGEVLGLVGESGCGKSTLGKTILRLVEPTAGKIFIEGKDFCALPKEELRQQRRDIQMIFQDPYSSLDPRMTAQQIIEEPMIIHQIGDAAYRKKRVKELLECVGLASFHANRYPQEFSGGQRQRIGIARALAVDPKLIICDEPVSALDVSVQAQVLNLLKELQKDFDLTYLFIAHGLSVVRHVSDRVGVMYLGKIVEIAPKVDIYEKNRHPYTAALMNAIPIPDPEANHELEQPLNGEVPSPANPPSGCRFHTRCPYADACGGRCSQEEPVLREVSPDHWVACHLTQE